MAFTIPFQTISDSTNRTEQFVELIKFNSATKIT